MTNNKLITPQPKNHTQFHHKKNIPQPPTKQRPFRKGGRGR